MINVNEIVTPQNIGEYWVEDQKFNPPYNLGTVKFPEASTVGLKLKWIVGANRAPATLSPTTLEANHIPLGRYGFQTMETDIPAFKNSMQMNAENYMEISIIDENATEVVQRKVKEIYDDFSTLIKNAQVTREALRWQLLSTGVISISGNGVSATYNYNIPSNHKANATVVWSDHINADPIKDLRTWADVIETETGEAPAEVYMNKATYNHMVSSKKIIDAIYRGGIGDAYPDDNAITQYISQKTNLTVVVYNKGYRNPETGLFTYFIPNGAVTLTPSGALGTTWISKTPEELALSDDSEAQLYVVDNGVALYKMVKRDGVLTAIGASMLCLPSFERANDVFFGSVL